MLQLHLPNHSGLSCQLRVEVQFHLITLPLSKGALLISPSCHPQEKHRPSQWLVVAPC